MTPTHTGPGTPPRLPPQLPPRLIVLAGATASGKTSLALDLARAWGAELVGADSVQLYRRLTIGSAAPTPEELGGVPHHLVAVAELDEPFDAARYIALADASIRDIRARGKIPLVVGGAGLYLRALVYGLAEGIPADPEVRAGLQSRIDAGGLPELARMHAELAAVDPAYAAMIHPTDPIRVVRALEVFTLSGVPLSEHHRRHRLMPPRYSARFVVLDVDRGTLRRRIAERAWAMLSAGWIAEVEGILRDGYDPGLKPLRSVGYAEVVKHVRGELPRAELEAAVTLSTAAFAKRQRTWFRAERGAETVSPERLLDPDYRAGLLEFLRE